MANQHFKGYFLIHYMTFLLYIRWCVAAAGCCNLDLVPGL